MDKKILIAVPCMDMVHASFAQSLASLNKVGQCMVNFSVGSLIYDSRNKLAAKAMKEEADYILWLDSDMVFSPDLLEKLIDDDKDMVSGIYFRRTSPWTPVIFKDSELKDSRLEWTDYVEYPKETLFKVAGAGFGCVLMKTDILFDMVGRFGDWFSPLYNSGEDLSFCYRARELGYEIWCDSRVKCGHMSHQMITEDFYEAFRRE